MKYAAKGETVTCENGHPICDFACDVIFGEAPKNINDRLTNWRQPMPEHGQYPVPKCEKCGADFYGKHLGIVLHFEDGWRDEEYFKQKGQLK